MGPSKQNCFWRDLNKMARLISLSPVAIFIVLAVVAVFTEASSYCGKDCYPKDSGFEYIIKKEDGSVKKFIENGWKPGCKKTPNVIDIEISFCNNKIADNTRYVAKHIIINICGKCYYVRCVRGYINFAGISILEYTSEKERISYKHCIPPKKY